MTKEKQPTRSAIQQAMVNHFQISKAATARAMGVSTRTIRSSISGRKTWEQLDPEERMAAIDNAQRIILAKGL